MAKNYVRILWCRWVDLQVMSKQLSNLFVQFGQIPNQEITMDSCFKLG